MKISSSHSSFMKIYRRARELHVKYESCRKVTFRLKNYISKFMTADRVIIQT